MIRNYSGKITQFRDKYLEMVDLDINMWLNDVYEKPQFDKLTSNIKKLIFSLRE